MEKRVIAAELESEGTEGKESREGEKTKIGAEDMRYVENDGRTARVNTVNGGFELLKGQGED